MGIVTALFNQESLEFEPDPRGVDGVEDIPAIDNQITNTIEFGYKGLVEEQFLKWIDNPLAVDEAWRAYFESLAPTDWPQISSAAFSTSSSGATPWRATGSPTSHRSSGTSRPSSNRSGRVGEAMHAVQRRGERGIR